MQRTSHRFLALVLAAASFLAAHAQAVPTASANLTVSAFAGISGNYTGLELARNGDLQAGIDIGVHPVAGWYPAIEVRGLYPVDKGRLVNYDNLVAGLRLGREKGPLHAYGDVLYGRGNIKFPGGYPTPTNSFLVIANSSSVLSFGGGVDFDFSRHFGLKGDFQFQRYDSPVSTTGSLVSKVFTAAIVYRLGSGGLHGLRGRR